MNGHHTANGRIVGVVCAVPSRVIANADCPDPAAADEAAKMTGVRERRWVRAGQSAQTLCTDAARHLLREIDWNPEQIALLIYVTQTPDGAVPADVYRIAADLGMQTHCACAQVNWSCSGYVHGLWAAMRLLGPGQRALLLVGDATSPITDPSDRATAPLFGDAGSATAIIGGRPEQHFILGSDGGGADKLSCPMRGWMEREGPFLEMDGAAVFNFTLQRVPELVRDVLEYGRPDYVLFHQANAFMLRHLIKKAGIVGSFEPHQIPMNIERWGNTSCASIPLLMADGLRARLREGPTRLAMLGYGAGFAWAGASITSEPMDCVDLIEV